MANHAWLRKFLLVGRIRGVPVFAHWTLPAIAIFLLGVGVEQELTAAATVFCYLTMLAAHELGHQLVAQ